MTDDKSKKAHREFWIEVNEYASEDSTGEALVWSYNPAHLHEQIPLCAQSPIIHVIEYSRVLELEKEIERLNKECISLLLHESRMEKLNQQNEKMKQALKDIEPILCVDRDDFEKLRIQEFKEFNIHEIDTAWTIVDEALKEMEKKDER